MTSPIDIDRLDRVLRDEAHRQRIPGLVAWVARGDECHTNTYGLADVHMGTAVTGQTMFHGGSLGKSLTAALIMTFAEAGQISVHDTIRRHLPDAPADWSDITVHHLLTHTSGIDDYIWAYDAHRRYSQDEFFALATRQRRLFPAGARWNYSNTGYLLLGILIERLTNQTLSHVLRQRILTPLGMPTARCADEVDSETDIAIGYVLIDGVLRKHDEAASVVTGDGSVYLSADDLAVWYRALRNATLLSPSSWSAVFEPVRLASGRPYPYGYGWHLAANRRRAAMHRGLWLGWTTYMRCYLERAIGIVVLANLAGANIERIADGIATFLDPDLTGPQAAVDLTPLLPSTDIEELIVSAAEGRLSPDSFSYVRWIQVFPAVTRRYRDLLGTLGKLQRLSLMETSHLGDDDFRRYNARFRQGELIVDVATAPDGTISLFELREK